MYSHINKQCTKQSEEQNMKIGTSVGNAKKEKNKNEKRKMKNEK